MFEWIKRSFDGQSIEVVAQLGAAEFMPLSHKSINETLRGQVLTKAEHGNIRELACELRNLEYNGIMQIPEYISDEFYEFMDLVEPIASGSEIFRIKFKQSDEHEFQFYAEDEFVLASYTMAFMIAAGIGEVVDMSHYFRDQKIYDLVEHNSAKRLLTVITFSDGRQLALLYQDEVMELLLGTIQFTDKIVFRYGDCMDIIDWQYNTTYDTYYVTRVSASEWQDYYGECAGDDEDDFFEDEDEFDD